MPPRSLLTATKDILAMNPITLTSPRAPSPAPLPPVSGASLSPTGAIAMRATQRAIALPLLVASALLVPALASAQVANGDFSSGLAGWDTAGDASVAAASAIDPTRLWLTTASVDFEDDAGAGLAAGARNASGSAAVGTGMPGGLESFAGLPLGALDPAPAQGLVAYEGSAARQTFEALAGSTLHFRWDFGTLDNAQPDVAFVVIDGQATTLASLVDATLPGTDGNAAHTGWQDFGFTFATGGPHTISFGVADVGDYDGTSTLAVADVRVSAVPEPASGLMLLAGLALLGLKVTRRRA
jgi:hypothetical protein